MLQTKPFVLRGLAAAVLATCILSTGCGPTKGTLKGKVTLDGVVLKGGRVDFVNKSGGRSATAEINEDGTYSIPSIFSGEYSISVDTEYLKAKPSANNMGANYKGSMPSGMPAGMMKGPSGPPSKGPPKDVEKEMAKHEVPAGYQSVNPADIAKKYVKLPSKYSDAAQSGFTYAFPGGDQTFDIAMVGGSK